MAQSVTASAETGNHKWWSLASVCFGLFMALLDVTIVNVALPTIQADLHSSFNSLQWVVNAYALVFAVVLVSSARLGDIFGRKRMFMIGMGVFTLGSILCAISGDIHIASLSGVVILNISRGIQGLGASAMMPLSLAIISQEFKGPERGKAFGIWGGISGVATAIGPLLGGVLVQNVSWQSIFWINVPIGVVGLLLASWAIRETRDETATRRIDIYGLVMLTISMFCLILGLMEADTKGWTSAYILTLFIAAAVAMAAFILGELRVRSPMMDPRLFKIPSFIGANIGGFVLSAGMYALLFYLTLYLQNVLGFDALGAGLRFLPLSALALLGAPIAGIFTDKIGAKWITFIALLLLTISVGLMTVISPNDKASDWVVLLPAFIVGGIGNGMINPPLSTLAVGTVPTSRSGMASGVSSVSRQLGIAFGVAFLGSLLSSHYSANLKQSLQSMNLQGIPDAAKAKLISGLQQAGPIAGSTGFKGNVPAQYQSFAGTSTFAQIGHAAQTAFVQGTIEVFWVAAAMLAVGTVLCAVLIRRKDMQH